MGIKSLNKLKKQNCPNGEREVRLSAFSGRRVAIDGGTWSFSKYSAAMKSVINTTEIAMYKVDKDAVQQAFLFQCRWSINMLLAAGITPIFVPDGKQVPPEKELERSKRRQSHQKNEEKLMQMEDSFYALPPTQRTSSMCKDIKKLYSRDYPRKEDIDALELMLEAAGIPIIHATGESEWLCAKLCRESICDAVISTDTDCMAHRAPVMISEILPKRKSKISGKRENFAKVNIYNNILQDLGWTPERFTDLCIILGCDYNQKLKGIGPEPAFKLMSEFESIDVLPFEWQKPTKNGKRKTKIDTSTLDYETCRVYFGEHTFEELVDSNYHRLEKLGFDLNIDKLAYDGRERLESMGMTEWVEQLVNFFYTVSTKQIEVKNVNFDINKHLEDPLVDQSKQMMKKWLLKNQQAVPSESEHSAIEQAPVMLVLDIVDSPISTPVVTPASSILTLDIIPTTTQDARDSVPLNQNLTLSILPTEKPVYSQTSQQTPATQPTQTSATQLTQTSDTQLTQTSATQLTQTSATQLTQTSATQKTPATQLTPTSEQTSQQTSATQLTSNVDIMTQIDSVTTVYGGLRLV